MCSYLSFSYCTTDEIRVTAQLNPSHSYRLERRDKFRTPEVSIHQNYSLTPWHLLLLFNLSCKIPNQNLDDLEYQHVKFPIQIEDIAKKSYFFFGTELSYNTNLLWCTPANIMGDSTRENSNSNCLWFGCYSPADLEDKIFSSTFSKGIPSS